MAVVQAVHAVKNKNLGGNDSNLFAPCKNIIIILQRLLITEDCEDDSG